MISKPLILKLMCVVLVASVLFPLGRAIFPYIANDIGDMSFSAIEAVLSASIGFGIYAVLFV